MSESGPPQSTPAALLDQAAYLGSRRSNAARLPECLITTLRAARERAGLTQAELAMRIGVSRKTVNTVENGVFVPSTVIALKLAAALDTTVEALFVLVE